MSHTLIFRRVFQACVLLLWVFSPSLLAEMRILASIKPLALIANEIAGEQFRVDTLLPTTASAHDYALRVSDARKLQEAELVIWVGPELETFLQKPLAKRAVQNNLAVFHLPGIHWPGAEAKALTAHHDHTHHHEDDRDPHLWLDPRNAAVIAKALARYLGELQPESASVFNDRAHAFSERMLLLDKQLEVQLKPLVLQGFAVYHEGYMHFVGRYGLRQLGYVTYNPERRPGARHLHQLRTALAGKASCLFIEPGYDPRNAQDLATELGLTLGILEPMGGEQVETYDQLLTAMANVFLSCLAKV